MITRIETAQAGAAAADEDDEVPGVAGSDHPSGAPPRERIPTLTRGWTMGSGAQHMMALLPARAEVARRSVYAAGQEIDGKVRLVEMLGDGGMGEVWLARHLSLDVEVAVKFLREGTGDASARARLLQEARIAARLDHPSIVRVYDCGTAAGGAPYMVMEVLRGRSLAQTLRARGRLSPAAAARLLLPVCAALDAAHAGGVVHRDLKPDNVILVRGLGGALVPKVLDFGIAKAEARPVDGVTTLEGTLLGSPDYMAPEQASGGAVDARADVWAFSLVLYELITGHHPFSRDDLGDTLRAICHAPLPPIDERGIDDLALWAILARGLTKDPEQRWPSMRELGAHLATWATRRGVHEDATGASIQARWLAAERSPLSDAPPPHITVPGPVVIRMADALPPQPQRRRRLRRAALIVLPALALGLAAAGAAQLAGAGTATTTQRR